MSTPDETSSAHAAPCGRIDAATGKPCGIRVVRPPMTIAATERIDELYGPRACPAHATNNDRVLNEVIDTVWGVGYNYGMLVKAGKAPAPTSAPSPIAHEPMTAAQPEQISHARDIRGRQLVIASGGYTYHWGDPHGEGDLAPGDLVLLPANKVDPKPHPGRIESLGSAYTGPTKAVLYLKERA